MREPLPTPLFSWAAQVASARRSATRRRRLLCGAVGIAGLAALVAPPLFGPAPRLVWNASPSSPPGLYWVTPGQDAAPGAMVVAWLPSAARGLADRRHYVPWRVPVVKRIAAATGDRICSRGNAVTVNDRTVAVRLDLDRRGRALPRWGGCQTLGARQILLLADRVDSFDGRYFGAVPRTQLIGSARLIWAR